MSDKIKFPLDEVKAIAQDLVFSLKDACEQIIIAGSIRREKASVGDIEIVYIPKWELRPVPGDMFKREDTNLAYLAIEHLIRDGVLAKRPNINGSETWGRWNKLAVHVATGIPVDLFETTPGKWFNTLVVRTGPKELNQRIATLAQSKGCRWNVYDVGYTDRRGDVWPMHSEEDVFRFVGLPYAEPKDRK